MLILIDADPIVYRCGFASETTSWHIVYETAKGEVDEIEFSPTEDRSAGDQMREWLAYNEGRITVLDKSRVVKPDPVSYALRATKVQIESIVQECEAKYGPCRMLMWISAGKCYRDKIATVRPYKGNRDPTHKPHHYGAIRDYLCSQYSASVARGIEADDAVSIYAHNLLATGGESYVICTIDKDLDQIPGEHYNYMNKVFYAITQTEAERWFVYQLLAGDITDNITGVWKCGPKQAVGILNGLPIRNERQPAGADGRHGATDRSGSDAGSDGSHAAAAGTAATGPEQAGGVHLPRPTIGPSGVSGDDGSNTNPAEVRGDRAGSGGVDGSAQSVHNGQSGESTAPSAVERPGVNEPVAGRSSADTRTRATKSPAWWPAVIRAYAESQRRPNCPYAKDNPEAVAIEMAQLVKLQEYPGQLWHPHGDLVVPGFGEENFDE